MTTKSYDILVFMNAPSPYWRDLLNTSVPITVFDLFFIRLAASSVGLVFWDEELPKNCEIVRDGVLRVKAYFYDKNIITA